MGKMFVVTHKEDSLKLPLNYYRFYVGSDGAKLAHKNFGEKYPYYDSFLKDNIADKNMYYCELTALYAIAHDKSLVNQYIGLCHYRRFFYNPFLSLKSIKIIPESRLERYMKKYDIVISYSRILNDSVYNAYAKDHYKEDIDRVIEIINNKYPEYKETMNNYFFKNCNISLFNMFYCSHDLISKYSSWLFSILFELENQIDVSERDAYQKRVYGFLAERLFNVWILNRKLKVKYLNVSLFDLPLVKNNLVSFRNILMLDKYKL